MEIINIKEAPTSPNPHNVVMTPLHTSEKVVLAHLVLKPGDEIPPHSAPFEAIFCCLEGVGQATIGTEVKEVPASTIVKCPPNIDHGWANKSDNDLKLMVVKIS
ncbi:MAG: cupin domain-containing protein [Spirochaetales bacterium]|jgi:quercetin dioxygenase-like cupin family protein|nr:cupin domain-containing protein [Spirochaetales bacterium]